MKNQDKQLTSVKVEPDLLNEFKIAAIRNKINLQKLVDRSLFLYLTDPTFRNQINNQLNVSLSGSIIL